MRKSTIDRRFRCEKKLLMALNNYGVAGLFINPENVIINSSQKRERFSNKKDTALYQSKLSECDFIRIATCLAEGVGISTTARINNVTKKTVLLVLDRASRHAYKITNFFLTDLEVTECQLDEMWSFVKKKEKNLNNFEKLKGEFGDSWIWIAFDAVNKIFISYVIGKRTIKNATLLIKKVRNVTLKIPSLFSSDQLDQYKKGLLNIYGVEVIPERKSGRGRKPHPKIVPPEDLLYVQVVKTYKKNRVENIDKKIIFGDHNKIENILKESIVSNNINTSYVERGNAIIRHLDSRCTRKTYRFSKKTSNHEKQLILSMAYHHLCLPHKTLTKRYDKPSTPFMAIEKSDHVWTMDELMKFKL